LDFHQLQLLFVKLITLHASCSAVYYNRSCQWVGVWVCYHNNSKLHASNLTKLGLYVKVVTISSWLNFGRPVLPGSLWRGEFFWLRLTTASVQCSGLLRALFH